MQYDDADTAGDGSPDSAERIQDFFARHGGAASRPRREENTAQGDRGWYEVYAADGWCLRCDWSRVGGREELQFREVPAHPPTDPHG